MSPVGHSLVGITIGVAYCNVRSQPVRAQMPLLLLLILCANVPDLPLPGWGHSNYRVSHSVITGAGLAVGALAALGSLPRVKDRYWSWPLVVTACLAVGSHYLLDSFYSHGKGVAIFWPVSDARLVLPLPWFDHMAMDSLLSWHNARVWAIEFLCYASLLLVFLRINRFQTSTRIGVDSTQ